MTVDTYSYQGSVRGCVKKPKTSHHLPHVHKNLFRSVRFLLGVGRGRGGRGREREREREREGGGCAGGAGVGVGGGGGGGGEHIALLKRKQCSQTVVASSTEQMNETFRNNNCHK